MGYKSTTPEPVNPKRPRLTVGARIAALVGMSHGGNVSAAARDFGIHQQTLARILSGEVANPRIAALQKIARFYGSGVDYILTGEGKPPPQLPGKYGPATAGVFKWMRLVGTLKLPPDLVEAFIFLPFGLTYAWFDLLGTANRAPAGGVPESSPRVESLYLRAVESGLVAWTVLFEAIIGRLGLDRTREMLIERADAVRLGFNGLAVALHEEGVIPANLAERFAAENESAHEARRSFWTE